MIRLRVRAGHGGTFRPARRPRPRRSRRRHRRRQHPVSRSPSSTPARLSPSRARPERARLPRRPPPPSADGWMPSTIGDAGAAWPAPAPPLPPLAPRSIPPPPLAPLVRLPASPPPPVSPRPVVASAATPAAPPPAGLSLRRAVALVFWFGLGHCSCLGSRRFRVAFGLGLNVHTCWSRSLHPTTPASALRRSARLARTRASRVPPFVCGWLQLACSHLLAWVIRSVTYDRTLPAPRRLVLDAPCTAAAGARDARCPRSPTRTPLQSSESEPAAKNNIYMEMLVSVIGIGL